MKNKIIFIALVLGLFFSGCMKIQTGQSAEEAAQSSEIQAKQIRSSWAVKLDNVSSNELALLMAGEFRKVTTYIYDIGLQTADRWQDGEDGRGESVEDSEMQKMVNSWISGLRPVIKAHEDNLEYAFEKYTLFTDYEEETKVKLEYLIDFYYEFYSVILIPQGNLSDYHYNIDQVKLESDEILTDLNEYLEYVR